MPQYPPPQFIHCERPAEVMHVTAKPAQILIARKIQSIDLKPSTSSRPPFKSVQVREISDTTYAYLPMTHMKLPVPFWWTIEREQTPYLGNYELRLAPKNDHSTILTFSSGGVPYATSNPLIAIMKEPPHVLTADERKSLNIDDPSRKAYTERLNGKLVFCSEWSKGNEMGYRIEFNHNPDSSPDFFSSEISFIAKPKQFRRYIKEIKAYLKTIEWNDQVTMTLTGNHRR